MRTCWSSRKTTTATAIHTKKRNDRAQGASDRRADTTTATTAMIRPSSDHVGGAHGGQRPARPAHSHQAPGCRLRQAAGWRWRARNPSGAGSGARAGPTQRSALMSGPAGDGSGTEATASSPTMTARHQDRRPPASRAGPGRATSPSVARAERRRTGREASTGGRRRGGRRPAGAVVELDAGAPAAWLDAVDGRGAWPDGTGVGWPPRGRRRPGGRRRRPTAVPWWRASAAGHGPDGGERGWPSVAASGALHEAPTLHPAGGRPVRSRPPGGVGPGRAAVPVAPVLVAPGGVRAAPAAPGSRRSRTAGRRASVAERVARRRRSRSAPSSPDAQRHAGGLDGRRRRPGHAGHGAEVDDQADVGGVGRRARRRARTATRQPHLRRPGQRQPRPASTTPRTRSRRATARSTAGEAGTGGPRRRQADAAAGRARTPQGFSRGSAPSGGDRSRAPGP